MSDIYEPICDEWTGASLYNKLSYSAANRILATGEKKVLTFNDMMQLPDKFHAEILLKKLKHAYKHSKRIYFMPRLLVALLKMEKKYMIINIVFGCVLGTWRIASPIILIFLLRALQNGTTNDAFMWAGIMSIIGLIQAVTHHFLAYYCYMCGWNWKTATTAMIYSRLFDLKGNILQNSNTSGGMLVNMISNDVARFEEFAAWDLFWVVSPIEVIAILIILIYILDDVAAAFAGVSCTFLLTPIMLYIAKLFAKYRSQTAIASDNRVRCISEIIDGINTVKSYAWEVPFYYLIKTLRSREIANIRQSQLLKAVNQGLTFSSTTIASFATFSVYWARGKTLTVPIIFATLSLLQVLKQTVGRNWTRSIETGSEAIASCHRIEKFLDLFDDSAIATEVNDEVNSSDDDEKGDKCSVAGGNTAPVKSVAVPAKYVSVSSVGDLDPNRAGIELPQVPVMPSRNNPEGTDPSTTIAKSGTQKSKLLLEMRKASYYYNTNNTTTNSTVPQASAVDSPSTTTVTHDSVVHNTVLSNVEFSVSCGELLIVVGPVGCGKSSLLSAVLGEINVAQSSVDNACAKTTQETRVLSDKTRIAYCAQRPWILASSIKSNITLAGRSQTQAQQKQTHSSGEMTTCGTAVGNPDHQSHEQHHPMRQQSQSKHHQHDSNRSSDFKNPTNVDSALYSLAIESCLLVDDFVSFAAYDDTEVGERGVSVSGGQKARISLARAVYSDADLYLLDDPLSAVDAHVGKGLFNGCILDTLRNRDKGVILVTHQLQYLKYADKVLVLNKTGEQCFYGTYRELMSDSSLVSMLELSSELQHSASLNDLAALATSVGAMTTTATTHTDTVGATEVTLSGGNQKGENAKVRSQSERIPSHPKFSRGDSLTYINSLKRQQTVTANKEQQKAEEIKQEQRRNIVSTEDTATGEMSYAVYLKYLQSGGFMKGVFAVAMILLSQGASMIADYWLRWWVSEEFGSQSQVKYVGIFAALTVVCILIGFYRALKWFEFTLIASSTLHEKCIWCVTHAPLTFFIANPSGRILNRFSKDQNQADETLPVIFFAFIETSVYCMASMLLVFITIPWLALMTPVLGVGLYYLRTKYVKSSREIKRIEATTRSPIYSDFSATLDGLVTLRAYGLKHKISEHFYQQMNENGRPWFSYLITTRWLGLRLDLVLLKNSVDVGLLGFTLTYTLSLSGLFQNTVRYSADVETQMTSIERMNAYTELEQERGHVTPMPVDSFGGGVLCTADCTSDGNQTSALISSASVLSKASQLNESNKGHLKITNMTAKYRQDLDPVLKGVTVDIPPGSKVGICGRTGSGKSSTLIALLRLNIITEGDIVLDGISLLTLDLETARSLISIIPQEPHLFSGTIRFNLDPFNIYTDTEIWSALTDAHISEYIKRDAMGLLSAVEEGGKNFSVGQRQLLSLARAILRKCKVVLMDEVTASIDFITDALIQETIRTSPALRDATIITVAHRLRTIADSDLIVMIQDGVVIESGRSYTLLTKETSHFKTLAFESSEFDEILRIASSNKG